MRRAALLAACLSALLALPAAALADTATGGTSASGGTSGASTTSQSAGSTTASSAPSSRPAPASWRALGTAAAQRLGRRMLQLGSRGADVRVLQMVLIELHYGVGATGVFDTVTLRAVKGFQRSRHLTVDGKVGPQTVRALLGAHAALYTAPSTPVSSNGWVFPIRGAHNYGTAINRYGAARSGHTHAGQDVLANCGVPLVAAHAGRVVATGSGGAAGNYLAVHTTTTPYDYFYAHMRSFALVREGQSVTAGQLVGYVGETGDATACHLHFELWQGAWWNGGHTIDPLPFLRAWDRTS
jgi:murein DD-endopeptidase MepM/ murein hydrolase activator NlpD